VVGSWAGRPCAVRDCRSREDENPITGEYVAISAARNFVINLASCAGLTRASITLHKNLSEEDGWPGQARPRRKQSPRRRGNHLQRGTRRARGPRAGLGRVQPAPLRIRLERVGHADHGFRGTQRQHAVGFQRFWPAGLNTPIWCPGRNRSARCGRRSHRTCRGGKNPASGSAAGAGTMARMSALSCHSSPIWRKC